MSWSLSASGHFEGDKADEREAALVEDLTAFFAERREDSGITGVSFSGQHSGPVRII